MLFNGEFSWRVYERVMTNVIWCVKRWRDEASRYAPSRLHGHHILGAEKRELHRELQRARGGRRWANMTYISNNVLVFERRLGEPVIPWKLLSTGLSNSSLELRLWRLWLSLVFGCGGLLWKQTVTSLLFWPIFFNKGRPALKLNFSIFSVKIKYYTVPGSQWQRMLCCIQWELLDIYAHTARFGLRCGAGKKSLSAP